MKSGRAAQKRTILSLFTFLCTTFSPVVLVFVGYEMLKNVRHIYTNAPRRCPRRGSPRGVPGRAEFSLGGRSSTGWASVSSRTSTISSHLQHHLHRRAGPMSHSNCSYDTRTNQFGKPNHGLFGLAAAGGARRRKASRLLGETHSPLAC